MSEHIKLLTSQHCYSSLVQGYFKHHFPRIMMNRPGTPPLSFRPPLDDTTNSPHSRTPSPSSPTYHTARSCLPNLRRKLSLRALHSNLDSSEEIPSAHSSIYEASLVPWTEDIPTPNIETDTTSGEWDSSSAELKKPPRRRLSPRKTHAAPPSASTTTKRNLNIHYPHFLETITEQRSIATLRSSLSLKSIRKQSFSVPNPPLASITSPPASPEPTPLDTIQPPKHPVNPPPHRSPTPTGLPTFNTPEAVNYRLPAPKIRFRDFFKLGDEEREWRIQTAGLPRGVLMRGEGGILVRGRWRPPNVGRGWDGHPWTRGQGGSGLGGKRERDAVGEQQTPAQNSLNLIQESRGRGAEQDNKSKWKRFWEGTCFVCCGIEKGERVEEGVRMVGERERPEQMEAVRPVITGPFF